MRREKVEKKERRIEKGRLKNDQKKGKIEGEKIRKRERY